MTAGTRRLALLAMVLIGCGASGGCLGTLAEAMLAPESVALQGAAGGVQALSSAVSPADAASAFDAASTAADLDRIIADHPDAANRPELEQLRDRLNASQNPPLMQAGPQGSIADDIERRAEFDRKVVVPTSRKRLSSDALSIAPIAKRPRRSSEVTSVFAEPTLLDPWQPQLHVMDFTPIRVR
jgi:hypothetical protein